MWTQAGATAECSTTDERVSNRGNTVLRFAHQQLWLGLSEGNVRDAAACGKQVLPGFLFLGSYDNASRTEIMKALGITHILNVRSPSAGVSARAFVRCFSFLSCC